MDPRHGEIQRIEIIDDAGRLVAMLGVDVDGSRGLFVYDEQGSLRLSNIHDSTQTAFYAYDAEGTIRIGVAQYSHGGGGVTLYGPQSKGASVLYQKTNGSLTFYDDAGEIVQKVPEK